MNEYTPNNNNEVISKKQTLKNHSTLSKSWLFIFPLLFFPSCKNQPDEKGTNSEFLKNYDTISVYCTKCTFNTTKIIRKDSLNSNLSRIEIYHQPVHFFKSLNYDMLIKDHGRLKAAPNDKQNTFFHSLNYNREIQNVSLDTIKQDLRLIILLKKDTRTDTFIYFGKNYFGLNHKLYKTNRDMDSSLIKTFKGIENYCY